MDAPHTIVVPAGHVAFVFPLRESVVSSKNLDMDRARAALEGFITQVGARQARHSNDQPDRPKYSRGGVIGKHALSVWPATRG